MYPTLNFADISIFDMQGSFGRECGQACKEYAQKVLYFDHDINRSSSTACISSLPNGTHSNSVPLASLRLVII